MIATPKQFDPLLTSAIWELLNSPAYTFIPRPDSPHEFDEQTGFIDSREKVSFARGGNGSGKTVSAAIKCFRFLTQIQPPPREDTPFMVISDTYEQVGNICWKEKLSTMFPPSLIDWPKCQWQNRNARMPYVIALKPWPGAPGKNWAIEFRSLDQGRRHFQGRSFGGFWFSEQFEWEIFDEVLRGCRDTWYDGGHFAEFTPIDPDLTVGYEERMFADDGAPAGWKEFRLNVDKNTAVAPGWRESFLAGVSDELRQTRRRGDMLTLAGAIYPSWNPAVHALSDEQWEKVTGKKPPEMGLPWMDFRRSIPQGVFLRRGIDWGESPEHPFVCVWGWKDGGGNWFIFDEFVEKSGLMEYPDRRSEIKERYPWSETDPHCGATYADPSRPLLIHEFCNHGITTVGASNNVLDGIEYVRNLIKINMITKRPKLYVLKSNCPETCKQLRKYRWLRSFKPGQTTDRRMNPAAARMEPLKFDDDCCDAVRYMVYSDRVRDSRPASLISTASEPNKYGVRVQGRYDKR